MTYRRYRQRQRQMYVRVWQQREQGGAEPVDVNAAFYDELLRSIYKDGELQWP
jgi:hypothetical protein